jgi:hypothetical protein
MGDVVRDAVYSGAERTEEGAEGARRSGQRGVDETKEGAKSAAEKAGGLFKGGIGNVTGLFKHGAENVKDNAAARK